MKNKEIIVKSKDAEAVFGGMHQVRNIDKLLSASKKPEGHAYIIVFVNPENKKEITVIVGKSPDGYIGYLETSNSVSSCCRRFQAIIKQQHAVAINDLVGFAINNPEWTVVRHYSEPGEPDLVRSFSRQNSWKDYATGPTADDYMDIIENPHILEEFDAAAMRAKLFQDAQPEEAEADDDADDTMSSVTAGRSPALPGMEQHAYSMYFVIVHGSDGNGDIKTAQSNSAVSAVEFTLWKNDQKTPINQIRELKRGAKPWRTYLCGPGRIPVSVAKASDIAPVLYRAADVAEIMDIIGGSSK